MIWAPSLSSRTPGKGGCRRGLEENLCAQCDTGEKGLERVDLFKRVIGLAQLCSFSLSRSASLCARTHAEQQRILLQTPVDRNLLTVHETKRHGGCQAGVAGCTLLPLVLPVSLAS